MANGILGGSQFRMWGERGLVATVFDDISRGADFERWESFLTALSPPVSGKVTDALVVIEPDFGRKGFGSPDAVLRLTIDGAPTVFIVEAKRDTFDRCAWPQERRQEPGFNSRINGQIELNYRLSLALSAFFPEIEPRLIEPSWLLQTPYGVSDPQILRSVANPAVLFWVQTHVAQLRQSAYRHVIITTDKKNPVPTLPQKEATRPRIYDSYGQEAWAEFEGMLHWLSWSNLAQLAGGWATTSSFLPTLAFNSPNLRFECEPAADDPPAGGADTGIRGRGVAMVRLRQTFMNLHPQAVVPSSTFVHMSWNGNSCVLRNYYAAGPPHPTPLETAEIQQHICDRENYGATRPPVLDWQAWHAETHRLNQRSDCDAVNRV